jgi:hypothetical protein
MEARRREEVGREAVKVFRRRGLPSATDRTDRGQARGASLRGAAMGKRGRQGGTDCGGGTGPVGLDGLSSSILITYSSDWPNRSSQAGSKSSRPSLIKRMPSVKSSGICCGPASFGACSAWPEVHRRFSNKTKIMMGPSSTSTPAAGPEAFRPMAQRFGTNSGPGSASHHSSWAYQMPRPSAIALTCLLSRDQISAHSGFPQAHCQVWSSPLKLPRIWASACHPEPEAQRRGPGSRIGQ